jgi:hypothetical protein
MPSVLFLFRINPENDPNISISFMAKAEGAIIFLDFSKAFDSLEWDFMFSTLKHYGFNYSVVTWVETLYNNIQTCVINNGWISEIFKNTRGSRQGYILYLPFYLLFPWKLWRLRLRENKNINGIKVKIDDKAHIMKISQLADDTTLFVSSKTDIALAMNEI